MMQADAIPDVFVWIVLAIPVCLFLAAMYFFIKALLAAKGDSEEVNKVRRTFRP